MVDLSAIIVSYNTKSDLKNCLNSIFSHTRDLDFEVIVVDNASKDDSEKMVKKDFPQVKLIQTGANLGFGTANNLGAKQAKGKYLLFLNPDTLFFSNALKEALDIAKTKKNLGAFSCRLLFADNSIQPSGGYFPSLFSFFTWQLGIDDIPFLNRLLKPVHPPSAFYRESFEPDWITGAFMIIPQPLFDQLGGFDEKIFMYGEELELCYRIKKAGYRIYYSATPQITHLQAKSSSSKFALVGEMKGIQYFFAKHYPFWTAPFVKLTIKLGSLLRLFMFGIILGDESKKSAYREALKL